MMVKFFTLGISSLILLSCSNPTNASCNNLESDLNEVFVEMNEFLKQIPEDCSKLKVEFEDKPLRDRLPNETDEEWSEYLIIDASEIIFFTQPPEFGECEKRNKILLASQNDSNTLLQPLINLSAKTWPSINDEDLKYSLKEIANKNNIEQNLLSIYTICDMKEKELP